MQADEDVGKIAMAVPLLVSKALELFLQDLCDRTYEITLRRGAKTMNSLHLKQCVQTFNVFDFLRHIVKNVPDLGCSDAADEDRPGAKRKKVVDDEDKDSDEDSKRTKMNEAGQSTGGGRGRGRGRGRGHRRSSLMIERETAMHHEKFEDDVNIPKDCDKNDQSLESPDDAAEHEGLKKENTSGDKDSEPSVRNFDLNVDLNENGDTRNLSAAAPASSATQAMPEKKHEEYPGWSLADVEKIVIDPIQFANLNRNIAEDEEDYDEES